MDTRAVIKELKTLPTYSGQIVHLERIPPRRACYAELEKILDDSLAVCLKNKGLLPLYSHQVEAIDKIRRGLNVMVATSSASGKSLCYNIPIMEALLNEPSSCALYLFPTKALAQDQLRGLSELFYPEFIKADELATYDGDTPTSERAAIKKKARLILSNPDMLHIGIMPNHKSWLRFFKQLRYVVVDEAHIYRGVFGSQVANILRRLRRLCSIYGSRPQFILSSATVANSGLHASRLAGLDFCVIDSDGSPHGGKDFAFWNPPFIDEARGIRRSANSEAAGLSSELISRDIRTLTFARTRKLTELIYNYSKQRLSEISPGHSKKIKPYRAGYLPQERRQIEKELFKGELDGVVATNALELGIDIGDLDATVLTGYPGSIASTWQQAGRSGRRGHRSLSFLIGLDNPLDQYYMRHPKDFFGKSCENALVNPENSYILASHLLAAAWEWPLDKSDERLFGPSFMTMLEELEEKRLLKKRRGRWHIASSLASPAHQINIRATSGKNYSLIDIETDSLLETVEDSIAFLVVYPGAIYLHQGETYLVVELDIEKRTAYVKPVAVNYYTQARDMTELNIKSIKKRKKVGRVNVYLGEVEVVVTVVGYKKKMQFTEEVLGDEELVLPPNRFNTIALWFDLPGGLDKRVDSDGLDLHGGLHATEHAAIGILPLFALCDRNDIGGVSTPLHPDTGKAAVFIYDAYPGGVGISELGYDEIESLWRATIKTIVECPCKDGCPSCIQSPKCGNNNHPLDKEAALMILNGLLGK